MPVIQIESLKGNKFMARPVGYLGGQLFQSYLESARSSGVAFDRELKAQVAPLSALEGFVEALHSNKFDVSLGEDLKGRLQAVVDQTRERVSKARSRVDALDQALRKDGKALFAYQKAGIEWLSSLDSGLLADDMGLGKTLQMILAWRENAPVLVVCPKVVKGVWASEVKKWRPDFRTTVISGRNKFRWPVPGEVVILNADIMPHCLSNYWNKKRNQYSAIPPSVQIVEDASAASPTHPANMHNLQELCPTGIELVLDEAHMMKSNTAKRTARWRALVAVAEKRDGRIFQMTGTPLLNRAMELWAIMQNGGSALMKRSFGGWMTFVRLFNGRQVTQFFGTTWEFDGPDLDNAEVAETLRRVLLRRRKADVLKDLPEKMSQKIPVQDVSASVLALCDDALEALEGRGLTLDDVLFNADKKRGVPSFEEMSKVRAACAAAKISALEELVEEYEEEEVPVVVASAHRAPVDYLAKRDGWASITGDTSDTERTRIVEAFQAGNLKGVAVTIKAAGVGITLTRASHMIFVDLEWVPGLNEQCEDRIHRIGQKNACLYRVLTIDHPLENRLFELLAEKRMLVQNTVEAAADLIQEQGAYDRVSALEGVLASSQAAPVVEQTSNRRKAQSEQEKAGISFLGFLLSPEGQRYSSDSFLGFVRSVYLQHENQGLTPKQWAAVENIVRKGSKRREFVSVVKDPEIVPAYSAVEKWAEDSIMVLTGLDMDRASTQNLSGWNQPDSGPGHYYARKIQAQGGLAPEEWKDAISRLGKYTRTQISKPPRD